jgi:hypothetical protein
MLCRGEGIVRPHNTVGPKIPFYSRARLSATLFHPTSRGPTADETGRRHSSIGVDRDYVGLAIKDNGLARWADLQGPTRSSDCWHARCAS